MLTIPLMNKFHRPTPARRIITLPPIMFTQTNRTLPLSNLYYHGPTIGVQFKVDWVLFPVFYWVTGVTCD